MAAESARRAWGWGRKQGGKPGRWGGGDELKELAETFRQTVLRLSSLVSQLEAAHEQALEAEREKKQFYREVLRAITRDHFFLVDPEEIPQVGEQAAEVPVSDTPSYAAARKAIQEASAAAGMGADEIGDLLLAAGEAITNAMKHGQDTCCMVFRSDELIVVRVTDRGPGIRSQNLPGAVLLPGFSTQASLGMGYDMMLKLTDSVWLSTGPQGTTVQLHKRIRPEATPALPHEVWKRL